MSSLYKQLINDYQVTEGYQDIRIRPKDLSIEQHITILQMQGFIVRMDKQKFLLSEFFIEEWDDYKKFREFYEIFLAKYFV